MGSSQSKEMVINRLTYGTIDDIFNLIFRPNDKDILIKISEHMKKYPDCLDIRRTCYMQHVLGVGPYTILKVSGTALELARRYKEHSSARIVSHLQCFKSNTTMINVKEQLDGTINDIFKLIFMPKYEEKLAEHLIRYPDATELIAYCYNVDSNKVGHGKPLYVASIYSKYSSTGIIKQLLVNTRRTDFKSDTHDDVLLQTVASHIDNGNSSFETLKLLLDAGFSVNPSNNSVPSVLTCLCNGLRSAKGLEYIKEILTYSPNVDVVSKNTCGIYGDCYFCRLGGITALTLLHGKQATSYRVIAIKLIEDYCVNKYNKKIDL